MVHQESADPPDWPKAELTIPAQEKLPCRELAGEGITALVSPVGMMLRYELPGAAEVIDDKLELVFSDGSSYTVKGDNLVSFTAASRSPDQRTLYYCFNRLCDTENVTELHIQSHWHGGTSPETYTVESTLR